jgi:hypothetical protein
MTEFAFYDPAWGNKIHDGLTIVKAEGSTVGEVATSLASMENVYEYNACPYKLIYKHDDSPEWKAVDFADLLGYESIKWVNGEAIGCGSDVPTDRSADGKEFFIASDTLDFYNIVVRYLTR